MSKRGRRLLYAGLALLSLLAAVTAGAWVRLRASRPQISGRELVPGLAGQVRVVRDELGIPAIRASTIEDAYFGLGYVHAQDRLFQMELQRRTAQGRLSELVGASMIKRDTFLRALGLMRAAERALSAMSPQSRRILDAYARGVNAWIEKHADHPPPEIDLLRLAGVRVTPAPWTAADSVAWPKVMALNLAGNYRQELLRAELALKLGPARAGQLLPDYPEDGATILGARAGARSLALRP